MDFPPEVVGKALRKVWSLKNAYDPANAELQPCLETPVCPITLEPLSHRDSTVGLTVDGHVFDYFAIKTWLESSSMNPCTGTTLCNKRILNLSKQKAYIEQFLKAPLSEPTVVMEYSLEEHQRLQEMHQSSKQELQNLQANHERLELRLNASFVALFEPSVKRYILLLEGRCLKVILARRIQRSFARFKKLRREVKAGKAWLAISENLLSHQKKLLFELRLRQRKLDKALVKACESRERILALKLLEKGADPVSPLLPRQALEIACDQCDFELIDILIAASHPSVLSQFFTSPVGGTPLMRYAYGFMKKSTSLTEAEKKTLTNGLFALVSNYKYFLKDSVCWGYFSFHKTWSDCQPCTISMRNPDVISAFLALGWIRGLGAVHCFKLPAYEICCSQITCQFHLCWSVTVKNVDYLGVSVLSGESQRETQKSEEWQALLRDKQFNVIASEFSLRNTILIQEESIASQRLKVIWTLENASLWHYSYFLMVLIGPILVEFKGMNELLFDILELSRFLPLDSDLFDLELSYGLDSLYPVSRLEMKLKNLTVIRLKRLSYGDRGVSEKLMNELKPFRPKFAEAPPVVSVCALKFCEGEQTRLGLSGICFERIASVLCEHCLFPFAADRRRPYIKKDIIFELVNDLQLEEPHCKCEEFRYVSQNEQLEINISGCEMDFLMPFLGSHGWALNRFCLGHLLTPGTQAFTIAFKGKEEQRCRMMWRLQNVCPLCLLLIGELPSQDSKERIKEMILKLLFAMQTANAMGESLVFGKPRISAMGILECHDTTLHPLPPVYKEDLFELSMIDLCLLNGPATEEPWDFLFTEMKKLTPATLGSCGLQVGQMKGKKVAEHGRMQERPVALATAIVDRAVEASQAKFCALSSICQRQSVYMQALYKFEKFVEDLIQGGGLF